MRFLKRKSKRIRMPNGKVLWVIPPEKDISVEEGIKQIRKIFRDAEKRNKGL